MLMDVKLPDHSDGRLKEDAYQLKQYVYNLMGSRGLVDNVTDRDFLYGLCPKTNKIIVRTPDLRGAILDGEKDDTLIPKEKNSEFYFCGRISPMERREAPKYIPPRRVSYAMEPSIGGIASQNRRGRGAYVGADGIIGRATRTYYVIPESIPAWMSAHFWWFGAEVKELRWHGQYVYCGKNTEFVDGFNVPSVVCVGKVNIHHPGRFTKMLTKGIGRSKAFGFGLVQIFEI